MRGKKSDPEFISQFIQESVQEGLDTPDQIVQRAKQMIQHIDEEIRSIETKKVTRSKLLDVVNSFEKATKDKAEEAKLLPFYKLEYPDVCKTICKIVRIKPLSIDQKMDPNSRFAIKQLLECQVLARDVVRDELVQGEHFDEYLKFILREG
jgi:hypothetical protein